ncbi:hypothetical protein QYM36_006580 [Artemia franciscana]|uniref:DUF4371 domain-containing protein n=1 Tax=Artemia franciscana TaxID=6661 RepID=A0AA88L9G5_ARTSF|nr:hypothetical protein QYM36_006580 [Artemia franciscana]
MARIFDRTGLGVLFKLPIFQWILAKIRRKTEVAGVSCLSKEREKEILEDRQYVKALLKPTALLGRQDLALRGHDEGESSANQGNFVETVHLLAEINPDSMKNSLEACGHYMSHEYQNDYIEVIGNEIKISIVKTVREAEYLAVLAENTNDLSKKEQLVALTPNPKILWTRIYFF